MKKLIYLAAVAVLIGACTSSKEITVASNVTVQIDTRPVIEAFTPWNEKGLDMYDGTKLSIYCYFYDMEGNLVEKGAGQIADYAVASWNIEGLSRGDYQVLCVSFAEDDESSSYSLMNTSRLDSFEISQEYYTTFYSNWSCLGLAYEKVTIGDEASIALSLEPACAYVRVDYSDMTLINDGKADGASFWFKGNANLNFRNGAVHYYTELSTNGYYTTNASMPEGDYTGIYETFFFLPNANMEYKAFYLFGEEEYNEFGTGTLAIEAGKQYKFDIDCPSQTITVETTSKSAAVPEYLGTSTSSLKIREYYGISR